MRSDLSTDFQTQMAANGRSPRQLAVFHFPSAGTVRISDQALGAAEGLDDEYTALVEDWGELIDMAGGDPTDASAGEIRQMTMTIWDGGTTPFSDYFLSEDPENVLVDIYQWFDGLADSDKALIDTFVIQDPIHTDEASRLLSLDLVSLGMRYDNPIGDILDADDWPNALTEDIGKGIDIIVGSPGEVKTLCAKTAPTATLNGSILSGTMTVSVNEDLDVLGFSEAGNLQIGEEKMRYSSRTSSVFTIVQRGWTTTAAEHLDRDEITEVIDDFTYLVGKGSLSAIGNIMVAGFAAAAGIYTAYPALDPARIVFTEKPYAIQYAKGSTFLEMQFDGVNAENTAYQAYKAYDDANLATAAKINPTNSMLSLIQATVNPDRGPIVKAYLAIEHWESGPFLNDYAQVWIEGIGDVGILSRPHPDDMPALTAEVDIDHPHLHEIGGEHEHNYTDPTVVAEDAPHLHGTEGISNTTTHYPTDAMGFTLYSMDLESAAVIRYLSGAKNFDSGVLTIRIALSGAGAKVSYVSGSTYRTVQLSSGENKLGIGPRSSSGDFQVTFRATPEGTVGGYATFLDLFLEATTNAQVSQAYTGVTAGVVTSGNVAQNTAAVKASDDVQALITDNVAVQITDQTSPTKSNVNLFDITEYVNFDWGWFTGKSIRITYTGDHDSRDVYILHAFFDVEYRKKEIVFSDDVTCEPTGLIDDASGTITGTPDAVITRPDHFCQYLLSELGGLPSGYIDATTFAAAGTRYTALGYQFDGVLSANLTVREASKKLARQCRSRWFWSAGKAKIALREKRDEWAVDRALTADDLRLRSLSMTRGKVSDIINTIKLWYSRDWTSSEGGSKDYTASTKDENTASIARNGICEKRDNFLFDIVADETMAEDLLDYYLQYQAAPSIYYTLEAYLEQFDLEKEDIISVTSDFNRLNKANMAIRAADRVFGSGKLKKMNMVRIVAECLRYYLLRHTIEDTVKAMDSLTIELGLSVGIEDLAIVLEELTADMEMSLADTATVADALAIALVFNHMISENVTVSDVLGSTMTVALADTVKVDDFMQAWRTHGFGGGGFGESGFGGYTVWRNTDPDQVSVSMILSAILNVGLEETVTVSDEIVFSDGFGGPKFGGFGEAPFGR